jgi:integrase
MSYYHRTHTFDYLGKPRTIFLRHDRPGALWYYRPRAGGKTHLVCLGTPDLAAAEKNARDLILATVQGQDKFNALREATRLRKVVLALPGTLAELETAYRASAAGRLDPQTIHRNILALRLIIARATQSQREPKDILLQSLNGDLIHAFKRQTLADHVADTDLERRRTQRTVNSYLRQARSLFTAELASSYRRDFQLELPACIRTFQEEPGFSDVAKSREEYNLPSDHLLKRTFDALPRLAETDRNAFLAVWLALGFGLRKEEIAGVRVRNFLSVQSRPSVELEEVWVQYKCKTVTKNHTARPIIPVANGAWLHLEPYLKNRPPGDYVLEGSISARCDITFRNISAWMRTLGWSTLKTIHEFRAYAGCQVAMRDGIYQASKWLRHSSVTVTEKNYSRYVVNRVSDAPLSLPDVTNGTFQPCVVNAAP